MRRPELIGKIEQRLAGLRGDRSTFEPTWNEIAEYITVIRSRIYDKNPNDGRSKTDKIIDSTATEALRSLASGMHSGISSAARPWFALKAADIGTSENAEVEKYLEDASKQIRRFLLSTNIYRALPNLYAGVASFGTHLLLIEADEVEGTMHYTSLPVGTYWIANDSKGGVDYMVREIYMTAHQIEDRFGEEGVSALVKNLLESNNDDDRVRVRHCLMKNPDADESSDAREKKLFMSVYYEWGLGESSSSGSGNSYFLLENEIYAIEYHALAPIIAGRWATDENDVYGTNSPGMVALPDVKELQKTAMLIKKAIAKKVDPPVIVSSSLEGDDLGTDPGDVTYVDDVAITRGGLKPLYEVDLDHRAANEERENLRHRIKEVMFVFLFQDMLSTTRRQITATEVQERTKEKLLILGPVLESLNKDVLEPIVLNTFKFLYDTGKIGEAPEILRNADVEIQFVSSVALAQQASHLSNMDNFMVFLERSAQVAPEVLKKMKWGEFVDELARLNGVPKKLLFTEEEFAKSVAAEQQAAQAAQEAATAVDEGKAVQALASVPGSGLEDVRPLGGLT